MLLGGNRMMQDQEQQRIVPDNCKTEAEARQSALNGIGWMEVSMSQC